MMAGPPSSVSRARAACGLALLAASLVISACSNKPPTVPQGAPSAGPDQCVGVNPMANPKPPLPEGQLPEHCARAGVCIGQPAANWEAYDFQPLSCGYGQKYGPKDFVGKPTVVVHLAGWCAYCQQQITKLEKLRIELARDGLDLNFVVVNAKNADTDKDRKQMVERCSFPVFQDHPDFGIWDRNGGGKDDMYIYDAKGTLVEYLPHNTATTNLSDDKVYESIRVKLANYARQSGTPGSGMPGTDTGTGAQPELTSGSGTRSLTSSGTSSGTSSRSG